MMRIVGRENSGREGTPDAPAVGTTVSVHNEEGGEGGRS